MIIDPELKALIPPLAAEEYQQLESNIKSEGCREPILTWNGTIVDGHNRHKICTVNKIPFKTQEKQFKDRNEVILWMVDNQLGRRNMSTYDRTRLALKKEGYFKEKAKENQRHGLTAPGKPLPKISYLDRESKRRKETSYKVGKIAKVSHGTVAKVKFIEEHAPEERKVALSQQKETINKVYTDIKKKLKRESFVQEAQAKPRDLPNKKYNIIYADPAWKYFESGHKNQSNHYSCMTIDEIKALDVKSLADDNCILFLWVTSPILNRAFDIIRDWGFKYSTVGFVWVKKNKNNDKYFFGCGGWTRANAEYCLIATKGSIPRQDASISQIIDTRIEEHSKKPGIVRNKIVQLVGDLPRIELFARQKIEGWDVFGDEV